MPACVGSGVAGAGVRHGPDRGEVGADIRVIGRSGDRQVDVGQLEIADADGGRRLRFPGRDPACFQVMPPLFDSTSVSPSRCFQSSNESARGGTPSRRRRSRRRPPNNSRSDRKSCGSLPSG